MRVMVRKAGPVAARGSYRVSVMLYQGYEAVPAAGGTVVSAKTEKCDFLARNGQGSVVWNTTLALTGVHVDSNSRLVFELHQQKRSLAGTTDCFVCVTS